MFNEPVMAAPGGPSLHCGHLALSHLSLFLKALSSCGHLSHERQSSCAAGESLFAHDLRPRSQSSSPLSPNFQSCQKKLELGIKISNLPIPLYPCLMALDSPLPDTRDFIHFTCLTIRHRGDLTWFLKVKFLFAHPSSHG